MRWGNESPYLEAHDFDNNCGKHTDKRLLLNVERTKWKKEVRREGERRKTTHDA